MMPYLVLFAAGFAGSFHCIGMCGGFACALGHGTRRSVSILQHFFYNIGRLTTYCFLGGLAGMLGQVLCSGQGRRVELLDGSLDIGQRILAVVAGSLMIVMALQFFGLLKSLEPIAAGFGESFLATSLRNLLKAPGLAAPLAFGVFNGLLPCPLVYAFAAEAAGTAGPLSGMLTMAAFGLGTFPAMLLMGSAGQILAPAWRRQGVLLAGSGILLLGLVTIGRGLFPVDAHMTHLRPEMSAYDVR